MAIGSTVGAIIPTGFRISSVANMNALNQVNAINEQLQVNQLRLATGRLSPRMEDGPSFFTLQNKMGNQIRGKQMALDNIGDAKAQLSMGEAGLLEIDEFLGTMRDLSVRGANDTITDEQRDDINRELQQLAMAIDLVSEQTIFNEMHLLDGNFNPIYQVGPNEDDMIMLDLPAVDSTTLGVTIQENGISTTTGDLLGGVNVLDNASAKRSIGNIDDAVNSVKDLLNDIGGFQRKLNSLSDLLGQSIVAEEDQASRFRDADLAQVQSDISTLNLMRQLALSNAAQSNANSAQLVGALLGG